MTLRDHILRAIGYFLYYITLNRVAVMQSGAGFLFRLRKESKWRVFYWKSLNEVSECPDCHRQSHIDAGHDLGAPCPWMVDWNDLRLNGRYLP